MTPFGWWVALYFALASLAAGAGGAACVQLWRSGNKRSLREVRISLLIALVAITLGSAALVLDLEKPMEFYRIFSSFNPNSWIARGSRIISAFGLIVAGLLLLTFSSRKTLSLEVIALGILLSLLSVAVAVYPSLVLRQSIGRPLWSTSLLPALFFVGALHVGATIARSPRALELAIGAVELLLFAAYARSIGPRHLFPQTSAYALVALAALGAWLVPAALLLATPANASRWHWPKVVFVFAGSFGIRSAILLAGQSVNG